MNHRHPMSPSLLATLLVIVLLCGAGAVHAAQPSSGAVAPPNVSATWSGGPYTVGVGSPAGCVAPGNRSSRRKDERATCACSCRGHAKV